MGILPSGSTPYYEGPVRGYRSPKMHSAVAGYSRCEREISSSVLSTFSECFSPLIDAEKLSLVENYDRIRHRNIIP